MAKIILSAVSGEKVLKNIFICIFRCDNARSWATEKLNIKITQDKWIINNFHFYCYHSKLIDVIKSFFFFYSALMEAQDIFGLDFDFDEFEKYGRDDFSSEEEEEDYEDDTEDGAPRRPKKKSTKKSIYEVSDSIAWLGCVWENWSTWFESIWLCSLTVLEELSS